MLVVNQPDSPAGSKLPGQVHTGVRSVAGWCAEFKICQPNLSKIREPEVWKRLHFNPSSCIKTGSLCSLMMLPSNDKATNSLIACLAGFSVPSGFVVTAECHLGSPRSPRAGYTS